MYVVDSLIAIVISDHVVSGINFLIHFVGLTTLSFYLIAYTSTSFALLLPRLLHIQYYHFRFNLGQFLFKNNGFSLVSVLSYLKLLTCQTTD